MCKLTTMTNIFKINLFMLNSYKYLSTAFAQQFKLNVKTDMTVVNKGQDSTFELNSLISLVFH